MTVVVLNWAIERVEAGERVAIASVVRASGSVPGKPGARLAIAPRVKSSELSVEQDWS